MCEEIKTSTRGESVSKRLMQNAQECRYNGGPIPFGYYVDGDKRYQVDAALAPVVEEIFEIYVSGESISKIIEDLNARGYQTSKGGSFNKNSLPRILANRFYIGEYTYDNVAIPGGVPAIVAVELFDKANAKLSGKKRTAGNGETKAKYILTGRIFCDICGSTLQADSVKKSGGAVYRYYKCRGFKQHSCDRKAVKKEWLEALVTGAVMKWLKESCHPSFGKYSELDMSIDDNREQLIAELVKEIRLHYAFVCIVLTVPEAEPIIEPCEENPFNKNKKA
ncbi:MAG: recombinase family protein [Clostridia bacterium]|nr:recombinase family protein [Clostridia bacterium]